MFGLARIERGAGSCELVALRSTCIGRIRSLKRAGSSKHSARLEAGSQRHLAQPCQSGALHTVGVGGADTVAVVALRLAWVQPRRADACGVSVGTICGFGVPVWTPHAAADHQEHVQVQCQAFQWRERVAIR